MRALERYLLLQIIDERWREHLYDMDYLREGIHLRGFAQIDPIVAYQNEAFDLFTDLMTTIWSDFARMIFHVQVQLEAPNGNAAEAPAAADGRLQAVGDVDPPGERLVLLGRAGRRPEPGRRRRGRRRRRPAAEPVAASSCPGGRAAAGGDRRAGRPQRPVLVRVGQEVQEVPWRLTSVRVDVPAVAGRGRA